MYETMVGDASFLQALRELDVRLAARAREGGCPRCGGRLHVADYFRKPRGGPWKVPEELAIRRGLCCGVEGCRRRAPVASALFLGRRVYLGALVVLGAVLQQGVTARRVSRLHRELGVDRRTLVRWRRWWLARFPKTAAYAALRAARLPPPDPDSVPLSLLDAFSGARPSERMMGLLRWIAMAGEAL